MLRLSPYGASKAALEAGSAACWPMRLEGTGVTANALLPGGHANDEPRRLPSGEIVHDALPPSIMAAPTRWLASRASDGVTARRILAVRWDPDSAGRRDRRLAPCSPSPGPATAQARCPRRWPGVAYDFPAT